jgi:hypothetical protein
MAATYMPTSGRKIQREVIPSLLPVDWIPLICLSLADIQNCRISSRKSGKKKAGCPYHARDLSKPNAPFGTL